MALHPEYALLFEAFDRHNIRYCLLRDDIGDGQLAGDLDLLIDNGRRADALQVFDELGYCLRTGSRLLPHKNVLVKYSDRRFIVVDLHFRIVQEAVELLDSQQVLQTRDCNGEFCLPAQQDLLAVLVLHNLVGKGQIQDKHLPTLLALSGAVQPATLRMRLEDIAPPGVADIVMQVVSELEPLNRSPEAAGELRTRLLRHYQKAQPELRWRSWVRRLRHFAHRWRLTMRAPMYTLTGVDGVGKSSLNRALLEILNQPGGFPAVTEYMGPWGHYRLDGMRGELYTPGWSLTTRQWLSEMLGGAGEPAPSLGTTVGVVMKMLRRQELTPNEQAQHALVRERSRLFLTLRYLRSQVSVARFFVMLTAEMYTRYYITYKWRRRGVTVITDRYIYDLMTGRMHETMPHYRRLRTFMCWFFPSPTRVFLLYNDPDEILARKKDLSETALREFAAIYDALANQHGFVRVRTNKPPEVLADEIISSQFRELVAKLRF